MTPLTPLLKLKSNQSYHFIVISLALALVTLNWSKDQEAGTLVKHVDAIFSPKARVCFNSMSTFFQSECVYCDSRLYSNTISACTGTPILATNVTQAQAFCIATACLQVPVLTKAEPLKVATNNLHEQSDKLNLFKSSLLHGAGVQNKLDRILIAQHRLLPVDYTNELEYLLPPNSLIRQDGVELAIDESPTSYKTSSAERNSTSSDIQVTIATTDATKSSQAPSVTNTTVITTVPKMNPTKIDTSKAKKPSPGASTESPPMMANDVTRYNSKLYPNFNQIHAIIYNNAVSRKRPLQVLSPVSWRAPTIFQHDILTSIMRTSSRQPQHQLQYAANQVANLMQSVSKGLDLKRTSLQTGKSPIVLGRRRRRRSLALRPLSLSLNKNKQRLAANGTVTAQLNKSVNGTTQGNVAFTLNNPASAYIWSNPLTRVLTKNNPNKSFQWQFGKPGSAPAASGATTAARPAAAGLAAGQAAARPTAAAVGVGSSTARPVAAGLFEPANEVDSVTGSYVVPAARRFTSG